MEFTPTNHIVQLCLRGMELEAQNKIEDAKQTFLQAWNEAADDFEKYLAAFYVARQERNAADKLRWLDTSLQLALQTNDEAVKSAYPTLYNSIAACYNELNDRANAEKYFELANSYTAPPSDEGPFFHGTKADLSIGDMLTAGYNSNYKADLTMNHIYFTALPHGAGLAASLAKGEGRERVYVVQPTGSFENDPNVTDKKFPGNPTRSYRTAAPLKIVGELDDWKKQSAQQIQEWRDKLEKNKGEIIN